MSLSRKARETVNVIERLLDGVDSRVAWRWEDHRKHLRLYITTPNGDEFFIVMSATASDARARMNQCGDVKRELRKRGIQL